MGVGSLELANRGGHGIHGREIAVIGISGRTLIWSWELSGKFHKVAVRVKMEEVKFGASRCN
jgi:hypothetical protein